jgi:hypothetical protein
LVRIVFSVGLFALCTISEAVAQPAASLRLQVYDFAAADPEVLRQARSIVEGIFKAAGVDASWVTCGGSPAAVPCGAQPGPTDFVVRIVRQGEPPDVAHVCGLSPRGDRPNTGHHLLVFKDCVTSGARKLRWPEGLLLGYVIAHEVGHLLLPPGHSRAGIMQASPPTVPWGVARVLSFFSEDDERRVVEGLQARQRARAGQP